MRLLAYSLAATAIAAAPAPLTLVAARPIGRGEMLTDRDVRLAPAAGFWLGGLADPAQVVGRVATRAIAPGAPVRSDALAAAPAIRRGDPVRLEAAGPGFVVEMPGTAVADAAEGQPIAAVNAITGTRLRGRAGQAGVVLVTAAFAHP